MIDAAVILLVAVHHRLPWVALALVLARDALLIGGYKLIMPRGYELDVNFLGKLATWVLYASLAFVMVTHEGTDWPLWIFWTGVCPRARRRRSVPLFRSEDGAAMKAVVMAGGEGTRLRPLTSNQPKPMVPIVGKPCMEHIVELLREHGFEDVIVTVAFLPQAIRSYFGDGETLGLNIEYSVEESPLGTAGSVRLAADKLDDTFLVISGDALCDFDLGKLVKFHQEARRRRHDRAQVRREPARVRDRRHGRRRAHRALPREAVVGSGLLRHDQHGRLRPRARGAPARSDRPALRLLEGALPAPPRDGTAAVRHADGRLLAGHRQPRPVPAGELRRARGAT